MVEVSKIIDSLHPLERKILPLLAKYSSISLLTEHSMLKEVEVTRALQWLRNKNLISSKEESKELILLDKNGQLYLRQKLPERRFLDSLNREMSLKDVEKASKLSKDEIGACLGILKKKLAINIIKKGAETFVSLTDVGRNILKKEFLEEIFIKKSFPIDPRSLNPEEGFAFNELLKRRNIIRVEVQKIKTITATPLGLDVITALPTVSADVIDNLTSDMIKNKSWLNKAFRSYDVKAQVPRINYGKKHFENEAIDYAKSIWLNMGFQEMHATMVQTAFWNMDTLFVPQDHPARELHDTFYLKTPSKGKLPEDLKKLVKAAHENGGNTGSIGWGGEWSEDIAKSLILRTHTTVASAQKIAKLKKEDLPMKFFSVDKVFRNENVDWKHLFEFYQVDGIVVDQNATFRDLKGYLQEFFKKMGYDKIRIRPSYFPFTEPSVEVEVFHPEKKEWVELGGAGIFRPEVSKTLMGFECSILAWGLGLGRIAVPYYKINDLRDFNRNDLKQLRTIKKWLLQPK